MNAVAKRRRVRFPSRTKGLAMPKSRRQHDGEAPRNRQKMGRGLKGSLRGEREQTHRTPPARQSTKADLILALLKRRGSATPKSIIAATRWRLTVSVASSAATYSRK